MRQIAAPVLPTFRKSRKVGQPNFVRLSREAIAKGVPAPHNQGNKKGSAHALP